MHGGEYGDEYGDGIDVVGFGAGDGVDALDLGWSLDLRLYLYFVYFVYFVFVDVPRYQDIYQWISASLDAINKCPFTSWHFVKDIYRKYLFLKQPCILMLVSDWFWVTGFERL